MSEKKKMKWADEEVTRLIDMYEEKPCLWEISSKSYQRRDLREKALSEISEDFVVDVDTIKAKWSSLRAIKRISCISPPPPPPQKKIRPPPTIR